MKILYLIIIFALTCNPLVSQIVEPNYDESKVPQFTLPDPLVLFNGKAVTNSEAWELRRKELFQLFEQEVYGVSPEWDGTLSASLLWENDQTLGGKAKGKEVKLTLKKGERELDLYLLIFLPNSAQPVPIFLGYNFDGNHTVTHEKETLITKSWVSNSKEFLITNNQATAASRGMDESSWPVEEIVSKGFGLVTLYYGDVDPDFDDGFQNGVHALMGTPRDSSSWGSVAAWAWGLSRVMDYLEENGAIDSDKVAVLGHSRLGKAALWAGACDSRFAMVISNNSGCGGAALSKRQFGETVGVINTKFPHWFADNYKKYNQKEDVLPVDQHQLLALIAPRPLYVASALDDRWADPRGEFLASVAASPVWTLLGLPGLPVSEMPEVEKPVSGTIGYHIRTGKHDITFYDWLQYLDFAEKHFLKQ